MNTTPPTECAAWRELESLAVAQRGETIARLFERDPGRGKRMRAEAAGLAIDFSRQRIDERALGLLVRLAEERGLPAWRDALLSGKEVNNTEARAAWHSALRAGDAAPAEVKAALARMQELAARVREGRWMGATGKRISRLVHLGTGGSDLGPRLLVDALAELCESGLSFSFAANVDPLDLDRALRDADPETTLFVVVSKTFTTQETRENATAAKRWLAAHLPQRAPLERHFVAVSSNEKEAHAFGVAEMLPMWDWVGGRYSMWSPVGFSAMCAFGPERFRALLEGAARMDRHFAAAPLAGNLPVLMALVGVWNVNFLGAATHAVLPYSTALRLLPAYLQQLEMESNGKRVDREGRPLGYASAPVLWGAEGTVGQHSFHQLLHQGTQIVPADFIVVAEAPGDPARREILAAHAAAQAQALAFGRDDPALPPHRRYPGNRPSSTLTLGRLDPEHLGALIALYEHKVFAQGVMWNINSFDQWGVELGKQLAGEMLAKRKTR